MVNVQMVVLVRSTIATGMLTLEIRSNLNPCFDLLPFRVLKKLTVFAFAHFNASEPLPHTPPSAGRRT
jgi:hypothetical protein